MRQAQPRLARRYRGSLRRAHETKRCCLVRPPAFIFEDL
jgi:hypothetical protein